jgi:hypothetical protein
LKLVLIFGLWGLVTIDFAFVSCFGFVNFGVGTHLLICFTNIKNMLGLKLVFCFVFNVLLWGWQRQVCLIQQIISSTLYLKCFPHFGLFVRLVREVEFPLIPHVSCILQLSVQHQVSQVGLGAWAQWDSIVQTLG